MARRAVSGGATRQIDGPLRIPIGASGLMRPASGGAFAAVGGCRRPDDGGDDRVAPER